MKRIIAAASAAFLLGGAAFAQTATETTATGTDGMAAPGWTIEHGRWQENVAHMQNTVDAELARIGIPADTDMLTLQQLNELALILDNDSLSEQDRIDQARLILGE